MKYISLSLCFLAALNTFGADKKPYRPFTQRAQAQYLTTDALKVTDTCPGADIINPFTYTISDRDTPLGGGKVQLASIGKNIRQFRLNKKLRQEDLAERSGLSTNYIGMVERGEKIPSLETFISIII